MTNLKNYFFRAADSSWVIALQAEDAEQAKNVLLAEWDEEDAIVKKLAWVGWYEDVLTGEDYKFILHCLSYPEENRGERFCSLEAALVAFIQGLEPVSVNLHPQARLLYFETDAA